MGIYQDCSNYGFANVPPSVLICLPALVEQLDVHLTVTGDQIVASWTPAGSATFFGGDLIMKYFLQSFSCCH